MLYVYLSRIEGEVEWTFLRMGYGAFITLGTLIIFMASNFPLFWRRGLGEEFGALGLFARNWNPYI